MELRHLRYFLAVAEELHFGRAAERLRIAQPSLSEQVRRLEEELGVRLLQRTKRQVQLTGTGRVVLSEARQILGHIERVASTVRQASRGESGRLAIGFAPWLEFTSLPDRMRLFGSRYPDVDLEVSALNVPDQVQVLRDGRIDVAFLQPPVDDRTLAVEPILREPFVVAMPRNHRLRSHGHIPLRMLADQPYVMLLRQKAPAFYDLVVRLCREAGVLIRVRHEADNPIAVLTLVSAGLGVSLVPASAQTLGLRGIVFRSVRPSRRALETLVAWRRGDSSPVVHAFIKMVRGRRRR